MLSEFTSWLLDLVKEFLAAIWSLLTDFFIAILDLILSGIVALLAMIPVPEFMQFGMQMFFNSLDPGVAYFLNASGLPVGLIVIGSAYGIRLVRKFATLFQW